MIQIDIEQTTMKAIMNAIPIDWLRDYFAYIEDEMNINGMKITKDNIEQLFDEMIATWEKENEAN